MQVIVIDLFIVPNEAKAELLDNARWSAKLLRTLPGFIDGFIYERTEGDTPYNVVTTAVWENERAFESARKAASDEFQKTGFNPQAILKRLGVELTRGVYTRTPY